MVTQKLRKPPQAPPNFTATPTSIVQDTKCLIKDSREAQNRIVENVQPDAATFANVLLPLAQVENDMALKAHILVFYKAISTDPKLRDSSVEAQNLLDDFAIETAMNEDLFQLVDAVLKKNEDLDQESYKLLKKKHKDHIRNGLGLSAGPKRDRFKEIKRRLSQLSASFRKNLVEANSVHNGLWFTPEELEGVPDDLLSSRLEKGERRAENEDKLRVTFSDQDLSLALRYAKNSETRKRIYIANDNKSNQNIPLFKEAIVLRDEAARLLGYPNHAAFRIEDKMAKTPENVDLFLDDVQARLFTGGQREVEKLKQFKQMDLESRGELFDGQYFLWDHPFYNRLMLEKQHSVDQQKIAEYFPLQTTVKGMLEICQHLFGLVFIEISSDKRNELADSDYGNEVVWHEDVQLFSVWDEDEQGGGFVGYLYMDLFLREGKYGNAANFNLIPGFTKEDGTRRYPATALVCNFSKPSHKKPSLLKHDEVVILFHELGHAIHDLVSKTVYSHFHGTETVVDFGEAPSQMLENWCWMPSPLMLLSRHYSSLSSEYFDSWEQQAKGESKPPEQIPDEMIESLIRAKHVNSALFNLRQLHLGIFDMTVHKPERHEAIEKVDISAIYNNLLDKILPLDGPKALGQGDKWGHGHTRFQHLLGEYDAGYYSYLFSKVYSADMFYTVFKADPMNPKKGRRYRHTVLEKGGSQDEMKTLTDFLGREPNMEAFHKELCLV